ncbi:MAG: hypothetical protein J7K23_09510 [Thermoproteales archaeon]|nr:hypothetical protein [Thermoproteales archaeon]
MNLKFEKNNNIFIVPFYIKKGKGKISFDIIVTYNDKWVLTIAPLLKKESIPHDTDLLKLYEKLLIDNYYLSEVTYGLTKESNIIVHAETYIEALSFENFKTELYSVVYGVQHFIEEIIPLIEKYKEKTYIRYIE